MLNKILTALLSLAIAVGLWLYVVTVVSPGSENTYSGIPVVLQSEGMLQERGLMITMEQMPTVDLRLSGNRSDLNKLNSANIVVLVDVSRITEPGEHQLSYDVSFPGDIADNAINTEHREPDYIKLTVQERVSKPVPVSISYSGKVPDGFIADKENSELDHKEVQVTGPADVVNEIATARIEVSLDGKNASFSEGFVYTLVDSKGSPVDARQVTTNVEQVNMTLRIMRVKELPVTVTVISGGGATEQTSQITIDPKTIRVSGSDTLLNNLEKVELGTVDLGEILEDTVLKFDINLPEGINNETGVAEATVDIKFPNLRTKVLNVTKITAINVPEGMEAEIITKALELRLRGPKALIDELTEADVTVTVDFSQTQAGTATMRATVVLESDFAEVGAVGTYSVSATLRQTEKSE